MTLPQRVGPTLVAHVRRTWLLWLICGVGAALRFYKLGEIEFWLDEIFTAIFSHPSNSFQEIVNYSVTTPIPSPPLWFLLTNAWVKVVGLSNLTARIPSALIGVAGIWMMFVTVRLLFGAGSAYIGAALLAINPLHILLSREARFYAALAFLALAGYYCLFRAFQENAPRRWVWLYGLVRLIGLYTHLTTFFVLGGEALFLAFLTVREWIVSPSSRRLRNWLQSVHGRWFMVYLALAVLFLPMIPSILAGASGPRGFGAEPGTPSFVITHHLVLNMFRNFGGGDSRTFPFYVSAAVWLLLFQWKPYWRQALLFLLVAGLPFGVMWILKPKHFFAFKYLIATLPLYLAIVAAGFARVVQDVGDVLGKTRWFAGFPARNVLIAVALVFLAASQSSFIGLAMSPPPAPWENIASILSPNVREGDAVVVLPTSILTVSQLELLDYYFRPQTDEIIVVESSSISDVEWLLQEGRAVWLVQSRDLDSAAVTELVAWALLQPHVELDVAFDSRVVYLESGSTREELLGVIQEFDLPLARARASLGQMYSQLRQWEQGIAAYQSAIALQPDNANWHYRLARLYERIGEDGLVEQEYLTAIDIDPAIPQYYSELAALYFKQGRLEESRDYYEEAIDLVRVTTGNDNARIILIWQDRLAEISELLTEPAGSDCPINGGF